MHGCPIEIRPREERSGIADRGHTGQDPRGPQIIGGPVHESCDFRVPGAFTLDAESRQSLIQRCHGHALSSSEIIPGGASSGAAQCIIRPELGTVVLPGSHSPIVFRIDSLPKLLGLHVVFVPSGEIRVALHC